MINTAIKELLRGYPRCANITILVGDFEEASYEITKVGKVSQTISGLLGNSKVPPPEKNLVIYLKECEEIDAMTLGAIANRHSVVPYAVAESVSGKALLEGAIDWRVESAEMFVMFKKDLWKGDKGSKDQRKGFIDMWLEKS